MEINLHNYEAFLLDAAEGRLDVSGREQLRSFLLAHPELGADLDDLDFPVTGQSSEMFPGIESLYKDIPGTEDTFILRYLEGLMSDEEKKRFEKRMRHDVSLQQKEALFRKTRLAPEAESFGDRLSLSKDQPSPVEQRVLEYNEGLMSAGDRAAFEAEVRGNEQLKKLQQELRQCQVEPEMEIVFPDKHTLYRSAKVISLFSLRPLTRMAAAVVLLVMVSVLLWPGSGDKQPVLAHTEPVSVQEQSSTVQETFVAATPEEDMSRKPIASANEAVLKSNKPATRKSPPPVQTELIAANTNNASEEIPAGVAKAAEEETFVSPELIASEDAAPAQVREEPMQEQSTEVISDLALLEFVEDEPSPEKADKIGLWQKAAAFAGHIRNLGVKGVEAEQHTGSVRFGFNTLTVEKKFSGL